METIITGPSVCESTNIGVIIIGRNEGDRLIVCLKSVLVATTRVVYVDSGSTDGSIEYSLNCGVEVVLLDNSKPFTAARARNAGFERLQSLWPNIQYVQFVDGDCEMLDGWLAAAENYLESNVGVVAVCGRLRERYPGASIYNRLCDAEWDRPVGETVACGGIFMVRSDAFQAVGGFRSDILAGEEPELCSRLRDRGGLIWRLPISMAWHDAAMRSMWQWWTRSCRGGFASALLASIPRYRESLVRRQHNIGILVWAAAIPIAVVLATILINPWALLGFAVYPLQVLRLATRESIASRRGWEVAIFTVLGKFPAAVGLWQFAKSKRRSQFLIDYDYKR